MYFSLGEYRFTLGEVMDEESDGSVMTLRNWIARGIINVGQKHKLGRWQFNIFDIIRIRTNFSLTGFGIPPVDANVYADFVVARAHLLFSLDENGNINLLKTLKIGSTIGQQTIFASIYEKKVTYIDETGRYVWWKRLIDGALTYKDELSALENNSHLILPIDRMIASSVMKYFGMANEEEGEPFDCDTSIDGMICWFSNMTEEEKLRTIPKFSVAALRDVGISPDAIEQVMKATAEYDPRQHVTAMDLIRHSETFREIKAEIGSATRGAEHEK